MSGNLEIIFEEHTDPLSIWLLNVLLRKQAGTLTASFPTPFVCSISHPSQGLKAAPFEALLTIFEKGKNKTVQLHLHISKEILLKTQKKLCWPHH